MNEKLQAMDELISHEGIIYWLYSENYDTMFDVLHMLGGSLSTRQKYQVLVELIKNALLLLVLKDQQQPPFVDFTDEMAVIQQKIVKLEETYRQLAAAGQ